MRVVGIDLGTRRTGVAVSDDDARVATPHAVVVRGDDDGAHRAALVALVHELGAEQVVVGLPLSLDGSTGPAARWATAEAEAMRALLDVPLDMHDERLSTVAVMRTPTTARKRARRQRPVPVDDQAAAVFLQSWLDTSRNRRPVTKGGTER